MTRDEVLAGYTGGGWDEPDVEGMADEIVALRERIAVLEVEREQLYTQTLEAILFQRGVLARWREQSLAKTQEAACRL